MHLGPASSTEVRLHYNQGMRATCVIPAAALLALALANAADAPPTADSLIAAGQSQAASGHKTVFLMFHASW